MEYIEIYRAIPDDDKGPLELIGKVEWKDDKIEMILPEGWKDDLEGGLFFDNKLVRPGDGRIFLEAILQECNRGMIKTSEIKKIL